MLKDKEENLLLFWAKQIGIIFIPFVIIYLSVKKEYTKKIAITMSIISLIVFTLFWHGIFSNKELEVTNKQLKKEIAEKDVNIVLLNEKIEKQSTIKPTVKPTKKPEKKNTLAQKAYKKLNNDNMINEPYIVAISVIEDVDIECIFDGKEIFHDNLLKKWYTWEQVFKFSDGSKIALFKKQDQNTREFIFLPYQTKIIK